MDEFDRIMTWIMVLVYLPLWIWMLVSMMFPV